MIKNAMNSVKAKAKSKANTEPSLVRNNKEGVENTKAVQTGWQVDRHEVICGCVASRPKFKLGKMYSDLTGNCKNVAEMIHVYVTKALLVTSFRLKEGC